MTVRRNDSGTILLEGNCPLEDAEPLLEFLQADAALTQLAAALPGPGTVVATQPAPSTGGGGGALGWPELMLLGLARLLRRRPRAVREAQ